MIFSLGKIMYHICVCLFTMSCLLVLVNTHVALCHYIVLIICWYSSYFEAICAMFLFTTPTNICDQQWSTYSRKNNHKKLKKRRVNKVTRISFHLILPFLFHFMVSSIDEDHRDIIYTANLGVRTFILGTIQSVYQRDNIYVYSPSQLLLLLSLSLSMLMAGLLFICLTAPQGYVLRCVFLHGFLLSSEEGES